MASGNDIVYTSFVPGLNWLEHHFANEAGPAYHVSNGIVITLLLVVLAFIASRSIKSGELSDEDLIPEDKLSIRNILELIVSAMTKIMEDSMGHGWRKYFMLVGSLGFFILFSNLSGLIPGLFPPTGNINTPAALGILVFLAYNYYGIRESGIAYFKHFLGPFMWLAPLMLPIEIISHLARPLSLTLRLFGNINGDHLVAAIFFMLVPIGVPVFTSFLGLFVSLIQTFVFMLLTMVYISGAVAHEEH